MTTNQQQESVDINPCDAAARYLDHRRNEVREKTVQGQATPVNKFAEWCEANDTALARLNGLDLQEFYDYIKGQGYAKPTRRNYMSAVRQFLLYLERLDAAPTGIADKVHRPTLEKDERRRDEEIDPDRAQEVVEHLERFRYASRDHIIFLILWRCGIRLGALRSLDVQHVTTLDGAGPVLVLEHRPEEDTPLKNGKDAERPINIRAETAEAIQAYIENNRIDAEDAYGREPLLSSARGRYSADQIRKSVQMWTCPKNTGIGSCDCDSARNREEAQKCEMSVSPHCMRSASITYWRQQDVPVEVVSDRMDVSRDVIEDHYDRRTEEGKAQQRRSYLDELE